ncbi:MAG: ABC transporter substrate-binding protein [Candidatus Limnocylindrales bacterium]|jgi:multiple sugar transport system substrate-binding protein
MDDLEKKPGLLTGGQVTRREVLKKGLIGAAGLTVLPTVLAACSSSATPSPAPTSPPATVAPGTVAPATPAPTTGFIGPLTGTLKIGSNHSDASEKSGMVAINAAFAKATGLTPTMNTVDHNTFQDQINNYLGGTPDDAFTWFSGYRMRFFASKALATAIDDVWATVSSNFTAGFANSVIGNDQHVYGIPVDYYPWCVFYRKSLFTAKNYTVPSTWTDFIALCTQMQKDGLTPIAFSDKDGWPAMGTFDILDLRLNGYDFHVGLMTGAQKWTDPKVTAVFQQWAQLVPFYTKGYAGLTWEQACDTLVRKTAGMFFLGLFMTGEVATVDKTAVADIDFFPFPFLGNSYDAEKALDAPIDVWMVSAKSPTLQADLANAKAYMAFWAEGATQVMMYKANNGFIPTANDADTSQYDVLTQKAVTIVSAAQKITQFMDRDTRPDFAGANGMQSFLLNFLKTPSQDLSKLQASIQGFWDALPPYNANPVPTPSPS